MLLVLMVQTVLPVVLMEKCFAVLGGRGSDCLSVNNFAPSRRENNLRKYLLVRTISRSVGCPVGSSALIAVQLLDSV